MWRIGSQTPPSRMMIPCDVVVVVVVVGAWPGWPGLVPAGTTAPAGAIATVSPATTPRVATDRLRLLLNMVLPFWVGWVLT
jgi:hypothetical protein